MKQHWRLWLGIQMGRVASGLQFFALGIMRPEDLVELNRRFFVSAAKITSLTQLAEFDLSEEEAAIMNQFAPSAGSVLILGSGQGREAIALAKRGWQVVGIENVPDLIAMAKTNAAQAGVDIHWYCEDITHGISLDRSFDLICLCGQVYAYIPTGRMRVRLLAACREHLKPQGLCLLGLPPVGPPPSAKKRWFHSWRLGLAWLLGGNRECQLGDHWLFGREFFHRFETLEEFVQEVVGAGLSFRSSSGEIPERIAVLKPADTQK